MAARVNLNRVGPTAFGNPSRVAGADFTCLGAPELAAAFAALGSQAEIRKAAEAALRPAATLIARAQRQLAPKGKVRRAIKVSKKINTGRSSLARAYRTALRGHFDAVLHIGIDATVARGYQTDREYRARIPGRLAHNRGKRRKPGKPRTVNNVSVQAGVTEFGTGYMAARPFMRPGYQQSKGAARALIANNLRGAIAKTAQRAIVRRARRLERQARQGLLR